MELYILYTAKLDSLKKNFNINKEIFDKKILTIETDNGGGGGGPEASIDAEDPASLGTRSISSFRSETESRDFLAEPLISAIGKN